MDHFDGGGWVHSPLSFHAEHCGDPLAQRARAVRHWVVLPRATSEPGVFQNETDGRVATPACPREIRRIGVFLVPINVMNFKSPLSGQSLRGHSDCNIGRLPTVLPVN